MVSFEILLLPEISILLTVSENKKFVKKQKGDVIKTYGNNSKLKKITKINKFVSVEEGMKNFIDWYIKYHV